MMASKRQLNTEAGEVIENVAQHTIAQYENSRKGKVWSALGCEVDSLDILLFICRADGRMLEAES
ncbi:hypothetical protein [Nitrosomonas sp. Nm34]|uniref:hypothetical protein n=1 Tax=Nitrosomonas sp. Nm34 TaxID=1881055 RepID=UPI0008E9E27E|nr:hypothetical protein [Nitrosomonas sp. Nm34]SFI74004.1 hypothetical protein SAMN05428978_103134 [Nitrosomonas sp. Nm34]